MKPNSSLVYLLFLFILLSCQHPKGDYICTPCELDCDKLSFQEAGVCPHCNMKLIKKSEWEREQALIVNEINIQIGSGVFLIEGGKGNENNTIKVYYHKPQNYTPESRILVVVPGAGRNGDSYRDAWIQASEQYSVLLLSPMYVEQQYGFESYHLGGILKTSNLIDVITRAEPNLVFLNEDSLNYEINPDRSTWIFNDFDRLFNEVKTATGSMRSSYDIFGHSAGGQILHRFVIFYPNSKADRILASNSGFYTLTDFDQKFPFGIQNTGLKEADLAMSFNKKLVLFIGEFDNQHETGGSLLRSASADRQGLHRLERAKYFYDTSEELAGKLNQIFNWRLNIVPDVGHDQRNMGKAAAMFLYGKEES